MNFTLQFLSYIREVVIETISYFIRLVRDFSINQYRSRLTLIEVTDINNILNTTPCFSDVFTVFSKIFLEMKLFTCTSQRNYFISECLMLNITHPLTLHRLF